MCTIDNCNYMCTIDIAICKALSIKLDDKFYSDICSYEYPSYS